MIPITGIRGTTKISNCCMYCTVSFPLTCKAWPFDHVGFYCFFNFSLLFTKKNSLKPITGNCAPNRRTCREPPKKAGVLVSQTKLYKTMCKSAYPKFPIWVLQWTKLCTFPKNCVLSKFCLHTWEIIITDYNNQMHTHFESTENGVKYMFYFWFISIGVTI